MTPTVVAPAPVSLDPERHRENRDNTMWTGFQTWGATRRQWQPATCLYYARRVSQADTWLQRHQDAPVTHARSVDLQAWLDTCPPRARTRNTYLAALIAFYDWWQSTGMRTDNPARTIERLPERPNVPRALDHEQVTAILMAADRHPGPYRVATYLMAYAGMRIGEVAALRWSDIEGTWFRVLGKGARERMLPIHPELVAVLAVWRSESSSAHWLFPSPHPRCEHVTPGTVRHHVIGFAAEAGVKMVPHQLRHAAATRLLECGADVATVSAYLGHASLATTTVYLKVRPPRLEAAVAAMSYGGVTSVDVGDR
jgi:site-specific recombinase XerD